jgi:hypothetical protein
VKAEQSAIADASQATPGRNVSASVAPRGTVGDLGLIRTNLAAARDDPRDCPLARSIAARPLLRAEPRPPYIARNLQDFALAPLMDALDQIEHRHRAMQQVVDQLFATQGTFGQPGRPRAHQGLLNWTVSAISQYLAAREADQRSRQHDGLPATHPVADTWVVRRELGRPDPRGASIYEATAWGRRYAAADGSVRDLWLLSLGAAKADRPASEKAAAAHVLAYGVSCAGGGSRPYQVVNDGRPDRPGHGTLPSQVRVLDVGCGDGSRTTLVDWDRQQTDHHFAAEARPVLAQAVEAGPARPGSSCVRCKAISGCRVLPRTPDLLSVASGQRPLPRRSISAADLRSYDDCPAQYHLARQLKLRSSQPESAAIRRGRAVDAWLNDRHRVLPAEGCHLGPGAPGTSAWMSGTFSLPGREAEQSVRMLAQHEAVCPLDGLDAAEQVLVQHQVTCHDPASNLVWIATPDLLHTRAGGWTWRETKTSSGRLYEGKPLLRQYPQLALAVLMLSAGVLGGDVSRSRVELELLNPDDATLEELDPSQPRVVEQAREVLGDLTGPLLQDQSFEPIPGRACAGCEVLDWCRPGQAHLNPSAARPEDR